jgi:hypothetical protein
MTAAPTFSLRLDEATELGDLLEFVCDWLSQAPPAVTASLASFVGAPGYGVWDLRADCRRFAFLLGVATSLLVDEEETR